MVLNPARTMNNDDISKYMSFALRHKPDAAGIVLDAAGWTSTASMLQALQRSGKDVTTMRLIEVVETNDKRRFEFNDDRSMIRASQGHSVTVELGYTAQVPPCILFHGTVARFLPPIRSTGLIKGQRQHVHLSAEVATAVAVGARRGDALILRIRAEEMHHLGHAFFLSTNGVWLTAAVPAAFIEFPDHPSSPNATPPAHSG